MVQPDVMSVVLNWLNTDGPTSLGSGWGWHGIRVRERLTTQRPIKVLLIRALEKNLEQQLFHKKHSCLRRFGLHRPTKRKEELRFFFNILNLEDCCGRKFFFIISSKKPQKAENNEEGKGMFSTLLSSYINALHLDLFIKLSGVMVSFHEVF